MPVLRRSIREHFILRPPNGFAMRLDICFKKSEGLFDKWPAAGLQRLAAQGVDEIEQLLVLIVNVLHSGCVRFIPLNSHHQAPFLE
jgi:hypothetical protein